MNHKKNVKEIIAQKPQSAFVSVERGRTLKEINLKKAHISPDIGRYQPKYFACHPKTNYAMDYQKFHVADVQPPCFEQEKYEYTGVLGCAKHIGKQLNFMYKRRQKSPQTPHPQSPVRRNPTLTSPVQTSDQKQQTEVPPEINRKVEDSPVHQ